jgi:hypothetical protein
MEQRDIVSSSSELDATNSLDDPIIRIGCDSLVSPNAWSDWYQAWLELQYVNVSVNVMWFRTLVRDSKMKKDHFMSLVRWLFQFIKLNSLTTWRSKSSNWCSWVCTESLNFCLQGVKKVPSPPAPVRSPHPPNKTRPFHFYSRIYSPSFSMTNARRRIQL